MKKKILVVDDNKIIRELLKEWLELELNSYEIETAKDGQEGISIIQKDSGFDLVITDFRMPKVNGIELIRWIKQQYLNIKIILLSGDDMKFVAPVAEAAGADRVISKNFDLGLSYISNAVRELLAK